MAFENDNLSAAVEALGMARRCLQAADSSHPDSGSVRAAIQAVERALELVGAGASASAPSPDAGAAPARQRVKVRALGLRVDLPADDQQQASMAPRASPADTADDQIPASPALPSQPALLLPAPQVAPSSRPEAVVALEAIAAISQPTSVEAPGVAPDAGRTTTAERVEADVALPAVAKSPVPIEEESPTIATTAALSPRDRAGEVPDDRAPASAPEPAPAKPAPPALAAGSAETSTPVETGGGATTRLPSVAQPTGDRNGEAAPTPEHAPGNQPTATRDPHHATDGASLTERLRKAAANRAEATRASLEPPISRVRRSMLPDPVRPSIDAVPGRRERPVSAREAEDRLALLEAEVAGLELASSRPIDTRADRSRRLPPVDGRRLRLATARPLALRHDAPGPRAGGSRAARSDPFEHDDEAEIVIISSSDRPIHHVAHLVPIPDVRLPLPDGSQPGQASEEAEIEIVVTRAAPEVSNR